MTHVIHNMENQRHGHLAIWPIWGYSWAAPHSAIEKSLLETKRCGVYPPFK
jgi:hypothetical protein